MKKLLLLFFCSLFSVSCSYFTGEHEAEEKATILIVKEPESCEIVLWADQEYISSIVLDKKDCPVYIITREQGVK